MYDPIMRAGVCQPIPHVEVIRAGSFCDGPEFLDLPAVFELTKDGSFELSLPSIDG